MKKAVLISLRPTWCELIARAINPVMYSIIKKVEVRKTRPKLETPFKVYIYCTKDKKNTFFPPLTQKLLNESPKDFVIDRRGNGKVIGEFICNEITVAERGNYCVLKKSETLIDELDLLEYADGKTVYGWHISDLVIYDKPKELNEFRLYDVRAYYDEELKLPMPTHEIKRPPQSWCYVEELGA